MKKEVSLKDIASFSKGTQINGDLLIEDGKYEYLNGGIKSSGKWNGFNVDENTVTISEGGNSCGYVNFMNEKFWCGAHCYYLFDIRCKSKYLYYLLKGNQNDLMKIRSGACMPNIKKSDLGNFKFIFDDDKNNQNKIVEVFDKLTEIIECHEKELKHYDELIKARFVEMFGQLGTDTKGWGMQRLGDCCELNPKKGNDKRLGADLNISFVPMPAVSENGKIDASQVKRYDEVKTGFTYFAENDVLFAKITPCMENGKGAVATGLYNEIGFGSTEFHVLRPIRNKSNPYWIYALTSFDAFRKDAANNMTGSAGQRRVPLNFLSNYKVSLPPIELQNQFAAFVTEVDKSKYDELMLK